MDVFVLFGNSYLQHRCDIGGKTINSVCLWKLQNNATQLPKQASRHFGGDKQSICLSIGSHHKYSFEPPIKRLGQQLTQQIISLHLQLHADS